MNANKRSLAEEITEGFKALETMRNNEPAAWMIKDNLFMLNDYEFPCLLFKNNPPIDGFIPLYTHPADLTDEEIAQEWAKFYPDVFHTHLIDFARAILKKASEK
jgi:hypothetical protein